MNYLTLDEVAARTQIHTGTLRKYIREGVIESASVGKTPVIPEDAVAAVQALFAKRKSERARAGGLAAKLRYEAVTDLDTRLDLILESLGKLTAQVTQLVKVNGGHQQ